jgi:hypothetical protein
MCLNFHDRAIEIYYRDIQIKIFTYIRDMQLSCLSSDLVLDYSTHEMRLHKNLHNKTVSLK